MTDAELMSAFEQTTLTAGQLDHEAHVRLAWLYLQGHTLPEAMARLCTGLRRLTRHLGVPEKYHETITCAYVVLINERRARADNEQTWPAFAAENPDLLAHKCAALTAYYSREDLDSALAREVFVLPRRS